MKKLSLLIIAVAVFVGCGCGCKSQTTNRSANRTSSETGQGTPKAGEGARVSEFVAKLHAETPETLTIGSNSFVLEAYLWRNLMPMGDSGDSEDSGGRMIALNWLVDVDQVAIPANITLVKQYVIHGDLVWKSKYEDEPAPEQPPYKIEKISRGGPDWETGISVDVVSEVYDSATRTTYHITRKGVMLEAVY